MQEKTWTASSDKSETQADVPWLGWLQMSFLKCVLLLLGNASNDCVQKMSVLKLVVFLGTLAQAAVPWRSWTQRRSEAFTPTPTGVEQAARIEAGFMWFYVDL